MDDDVVLAILRECSNIAGDLSVDVMDHLYDEIGNTIRLPSGRFYVLYSEELPSLGYPDDIADEPYSPVVIRREVDGECFEVDVEVTIRRVTDVMAQGAKLLQQLNRGSQE